MRSLIPFFVVVVICSAQPHWPQFRGPGASGVGSGTPPAEWDVASGKNIRWKREVPGLAHSSPVIFGDRIFLTTAIAPGKEAALKTGLYGDIGSVNETDSQEFKVLCLDRNTGKTVWESTPVKAQPKIKRHPKSTHANPTPATDGKHLVVFFGSEGLYTYDMKGKLLWKKDLGVLDSGFFMVPSAQWGFASSPVIHDGKILIQADVQKDSFVAAFDVKSGKELWRTPRQDVPTWSTPAVAPYKTSDGARQQVVVNGWKHIGGYDLETGKELWKMAGQGDIPVPTPVVAGDLILITNAHGPGRPIYAIRTDASGDLSANKAGIAWSHDRAGNYMQTPLVHNGVAYFCFDNGVLSAYDVASGKRLYQQRLGSGSTGFSSSPVAAGGHLYITSEDGETHVIALGAEYKLLQKNDLGEQVMATPALAGDTLYIRGRKYLYAIGK